MKRVLVVGLAVAGEAVARQLLRRGVEVVATDDRPEAGARERARSLGLDLVESPGADELGRLVGGADVIVPSPGVPARHPAFAAASRTATPVWSEFELAARWGHPPLVAVTGTNGKTTVTTLVTRMLAASGHRVVAAGNTEVPLVDVLDQDLDAVVVEASSFRLQYTAGFHPRVAVWLNVSEDHLDWHPSFEHYVAAKARIWVNQGPDDVAVANADDPVVLAAAGRTRGEVRTFGLASAAAFGLDSGAGVLRGPDGDEIVAVADLPRALPHDVANGLAATAAALAAGAGLDACRSVLTSFEGLPHRVQLVGDSGGVRFYDDSKSTTPASVVAAVAGFDSVVLIAGGRNKGLRLDPLLAVTDRLRAVVAIGEAAAEVARVLSGRCPTVTAASMPEAVALAADLARPGDAVLLSPGGASQDWYRDYAERGDDFARAVAAHAGGGRE